MKVKYTTGGYKYKLESSAILRSSILGYNIEERFITLEEDGKLILRPGYACDGPSGPTLDRILPFLYKKFLVPAFGHDALYQLIRLGLLEPERRLHADQDLRQWCLDRGMMKLRARWVYRGVRTGGGPAADPKHKRKVYEAV